MRAVDTNVLVRLITRDELAQVAAADAFIEGGAWVSQLVLVEATWVLSAVYELSPAQIGLAIEMLLNHKNLTIQDAEVASRALEQYRKKTSLGFSDALVLEVARKAGHLPLGTFDHKLGKVEGAQRL